MPSIPKTYCLTVAEYPWRNTAVQQRFTDIGLEVEPFYGIHGTTVGIIPIHANIDCKRDDLTRISPGKASITISKLLLFQHILDMGHEEVLILENDVTFCENFAEEFEKSRAALPDDWQVVHVGSCCADDKPTEVINDRVSKVKYPMCCHAILWKREALESAYECLKVASWGNNSDIIFQRALYPKLNHYTFKPPLVFQELKDSEAGIYLTYATIQGWFNFSRIYDEQLDQVKEYERATFVEVGSWLGASTAYMAEEIKRRLKPVDFYAVDTWQGTPNEPHMEPVIKELGGSAFAQWQVNMLRAGVANYVKPICKPSTEAAQEFEEGSLDFVYLDADHTYESVVADIRAWKPKLKKGGCLAGHDYDWDGVARAVRQELPGQFRTWNSTWIVDHV